MKVAIPVVIFFFVAVSHCEILLKLPTRCVIEEIFSKFHQRYFCEKSKIYKNVADEELYVLGLINAYIFSVDGHYPDGDLNRALLQKKMPDILTSIVKSSEIVENTHEEALAELNHFLKTFAY